MRSIRLRGCGAGALVIGAALLLAACTFEARVPAVEGADLGAVGGREPGRYAAMVQSSAWDMKFKIQGLACAPHTYVADADPSWDRAMKRALAAALGEVDFVATLNPPASLPAPYDAQIGLVQSGAQTRVEIAPKALGLLGFAATAETRLEGALTIVFPDGSFDYEPIAGNGSGASSGFLCGDVSPAVRQASAAALRDIVRQAVTTAKLRLIARREPGKPLAPAA
jgi:hypothetical protein